MTRIVELEVCDGCRKTIGPSIQRWETEIDRDGRRLLLLVTHPNARCADAAEVRQVTGRLDMTALNTQQESRNDGS